MNLGQTFITMGMLILLVLSVISADRMIMDVTETTFQVEALTASSTIANDLIDEILSKSFDEKSDLTGSQSTSAFSCPPGGKDNEWGPEGSKERDKVTPLPDTSSTGNYKSNIYFDDVDDYIGYSRAVTMNKISGYNASVNVFYVDPNYPDVPLTTQSYYKEVEVTVQHPFYLKTPVVYTALVSY
jgi:hypothetical protein